MGVDHRRLDVRVARELLNHPRRLGALPRDAHRDGFHASREVLVIDALEKRRNLGAFILAHVCSLVGREHRGLRILDAAFGHLVSVDEEGCDAAFANAVAVVLEVGLIVARWSLIGFGDCTV